VGLAVRVGVTVELAVRVGLAVWLPTGAPQAKVSVMVLLASVTAPIRARVRPVTVEPLFKVIEA